MYNSAARLRAIKTFDDLTRYLEDQLDWPLEEYGFDDLTFEYSPAELGLKDEDAARIKAIHQLRPLQHGQPWGIFFVEFEKKRMPVVVLRRILSHLVLKKRASANKAQSAAWDLDDLLFISAYGDAATDQREIAFAHFHQEAGDLPTLRVLGWDGADTTLKLDHVAATLQERLRWPANPGNHEAWRQQWSQAFRHRIGHVIRTSNDLAERLALLARGIRDAAATLMLHEAATGPLRRLHKAFQTSLIHDLSEVDFADTYAQTITYGLLTAAISRTEMSEGREGTTLNASHVTDMVPITNPFLREMLQTFLQAGGQRGGINFDELGIQDVVELLRGNETDLPAILRDFGNRTRGEDPVIHFYEHFLAAYNKQLKVQRGVFYTPQAVVSYIVRSVHELLQSEFGIEDGLASTITWREMAQRQQGLKIPDGVAPESPFVQILDPATGTATFLVEVIDVIHRTLAARWKQQRLSDAQQRDAWNAYVPQHLLPRLHGYELMMAPYAIAHMKIGLKLHETGYRFGSDERARIYLTNALEPASDSNQQLAFAEWAPALAHEAQAVNAIKRNQRFTVIVGNPPYSIQSQNLTETARAWVNAYRHVAGEPIVERNPLQFEKNIQDDYVKFVRLAQVTIDASGSGLIGLVTSHGFLDGATFRGMRWSLIHSFNGIRVLDLHGNSNKRETAPDGSSDENVFDISQGVAVSLLWKYPNKDFAFDIKKTDLWGVRSGNSESSKYGWLYSNIYSNTLWETVEPSKPLFLFTQSSGELQREYEKYPGLAEIMPLYSMGIKSSRDNLVLDFESEPLLARINRFRSAPISDIAICTELDIALKKGWNIARARQELRGSKDMPSHVKPFLYRPFDFRLIFYHKAVVFSAAYPVMRNLLARRNLALVATRQTKDQWDVQCTRSLVGHKSLGAYDANSVFPLYLSDAQFSLNFDLDDTVNMNGDFIRRFETILYSLEERSVPLNPETIFNYAYAVFHSPNYRSRYAEFLKIDFPRLPLTSSLELFRALAQLGGELVALHLMESPQLDQQITSYTGPAQPLVEKISYAQNTVWLDKAQRRGFRGVPEAVWNFRIGGYQVCEKWLKDRKGRALAPEDIEHYQRIVVALYETIGLMQRIDDVIEEHGGWPGAFSGA